MAVSVFDIFKIGIGPSSSHTVGPMRAALMFAHHLKEQQLIHNVHRIDIYFYGSLSATGKGHSTDIGTLLGLMGYAPDTIDPDVVPTVLAEMRSSQTLSLLGQYPIAFTEKEGIHFLRREVMQEHPNGMKFDVFDSSNTLLCSKSYLSVGGGFVVSVGEPNLQVIAAADKGTYPFKTGEELLTICKDNNLTIAQVMLANELTWHSEEEIRSGLVKIWDVMQACVNRGCHAKDPLPGPFHVRRRAPELYTQLTKRGERSLSDPLSVLDWINLYAMAVNEENACGGRVVTAPTNGAAGIIPAVLHYYDRFYPHANEEGIINFLLTAGAIGILYKLNASISGAEVGCQGEVGVACSMAAAALCAVTGGSVTQVENAAEIGMEHNLGLTCDPVGGLVQIPCIERNAMGASKAVNAARMALRGDGQHTVSLDSVIKTMKQTGADMKTKYKETSRGGLAVNIVEC